MSASVLDAALQEAAADGNGAASGSGGMTRTESTDLLDAADTPFELRVLEVALDVVRTGAPPLHSPSASPCMLTECSKMSPGTVSIF